MAKAMSDTADATAAIAKSASQIGDVVMNDVAVPLAKRQAAEDLQQQKVVRNEDGSVSVVNPANSLIFGKAGEAYDAAVQAGTIAQHSNVISSEMNDLHQQHPADPASFNKAAGAWKQRYLQDHGGGIIGQAISQQADQVQTQHSNSITNTAAQADIATQNSAITATQTSARGDVLAMLRGGASVDDKAVQSRIAQFDAAIAARAANPLFSYSKEQAQLDSETFHSEASASRLLYHVDQVYKSEGAGGGYAGAMEAAKDVLTNPSYKLTEQQRDGFYHKAVADIRANEAIRKQDLGEAQAAFQELSLSSATGRPVDSDSVERVAKAFRDAGAPGRAAQVYSAFIRKPLNDDFGKQPLSVQTSQLAALQGANGAASAVRFFVGKGYTVEQAAGIVGNLHTESGFDPAAIGDNGTSGGLAQFHNERLTKGLEENPIATTVSNFPDKFKAPGPLDFSSEGALAGSLAERAAISQFAANNWNTPQLPVLDQQDIKQLQAALQAPAGGVVLTTMANILKPAEMTKLLDQKEFRDSVVGMQSSLDKSKMSAANSVADKLWRANPALAESTLGSRSIEKLQSWQALKGTFSGDELAKMLNRADDPALAQARKEAIASANEEVTKLTPGDMAYRLGTGLPILNSLAGNISGATPNLPLDSMQGRALVNEFKAARAELRAAGVDPDKADAQGLERLRSTWGISQAAGNRLMKNPPEMSPYYPSIGGPGEKGWISEQLKEFVTASLGPAEGKFEPRFGMMGVRQPGWSIAGLVSDSRTATEMSNRRPPSYQVAVTHNGMLEILPQRITFDPAKYIAAQEASLRRQHRDISVNRWAHGGDRGDFVNTTRPNQATDRPSYLFGEALPN
jgi:hypothetical protein